jgi:hypothetical protein
VNLRHDVFPFTPCENTEEEIAAVTAALGDDPELLAMLGVAK